MDEHGYIRSIHKKLPPDLYHWKINDTFQGGVADAFYRGNKRILFVEYKFIKTLPVRETTLIVPDCSVLQIKWLKDSYNDGVPTVVIVGSPHGGVLFLHRAWEKGVCKQTFLGHTLPAAAIAAAIYSHCTVENTSVYDYKKSIGYIGQEKCETIESSVAASESHIETQSDPSRHHVRLLAANI